MIRLLFAFEDCPSSQVASLLAARMKGLLADNKATAEFAFPRERGARSLLIAHGPVHLEPDPRRLKKLIAARGYDAVITIDAESYLDAIAPESASVWSSASATRAHSTGVSTKTSAHTDSTPARAGTSASAANTDSTPARSGTSASAAPAGSTNAGASHSTNAGSHSTNAGSHSTNAGSHSTNAGSHSTNAGSYSTNAGSSHSTNARATHSTNPTAGAARTSAHPPVIAELRHASDAMLERLERKALRGVIVPNDRQKTRTLEHLHGDLRTRVELSPDSADADRFHPSIPGEPGARPILVFRGELEEKDNWSTFLEIGALVAIRAPELELWMLGGEDAPEELALAMMETAESLGVLKKLRWFPGLDHPAVAKAYAHAGRSGGALLITRRNETSGQVALEALLAGCPVISSAPSAAGDLPDVKKFSGEELHEAERAVFEVLQDTNRRLRRAILAGRDALIARCDPQATGAAYLKTILKLIGRE